MIDLTVKKGDFTYYLTPSEIDTYRHRYINSRGRIDKHAFDWWLVHYFADLRQTTFSQAVVILSTTNKKYTEEDTIKLLEDLEWKNITEEYRFLGIENKIRLKSFAGWVMSYAQRNKSKTTKNKFETK